MLVVDTNLVIALVVTHPLHDFAKKLLQKDSDWHLPEWWQIELSNALRNYQRSGQLDTPEALAALQQGIALIPHGNTHAVDLEYSLQIACVSNLSAYDARFIALARSYGKKLVTEDGRLRKACPGDTLSLEEALEA
jgi:predicted nucleic acid-binding protein